MPYSRWSSWQLGEPELGHRLYELIGCVAFASMVYLYEFYCLHFFFKVRGLDLICLVQIRFSIKNSGKEKPIRFPSCPTQIL